VNVAGVLLVVGSVMFAYKAVYNVVTHYRVIRRGVRDSAPVFSERIEPFEIVLIPILVLSAIWVDSDRWVTQWWAVLFLSVGALLVSYALWFPMQAIGRRAIQSKGRLV